MMKRTKKLMLFLLTFALAFGVLTTTRMTASANTGDRDTTGYENATLPTGPDMSGDVITVTPENAQYTLDGAYGSIDGKTVHFSSGTYSETLVLARPTKFTYSNTKYYQSSDGTELTYDYVVSVKGTNHGMYIYERSLSDVTFTADDDVVLPGFYLLSGLVKNENNNYNYVLETSITGTGDSGYAYYGRSNLSNVTFEGLTISGGIDLSNGNSDYYGSTSGLTIENCTFTGNESIWNTDSAGGYNLIAILFRSWTGSGNTHATYQDIVIKGCTFENYGYGFFVQYITDLTVTNNSFTNIHYNALQLSKSVLGTIDIEENLIKNVLDRAFRLDEASDATSITAKNNVILNSGDDSYQNFKATSLPADTSAVSLEYNY
ncbi:MAG: hypothetical protein LUH07_00290, partial [Lachnospiraceae bacterium]|nr:hypothetical protein [Lachnospiraceae bacterium]